MRHQTHQVKIGSVTIGGTNPVAIQSMTNTPTADIEATYAQIVELVQAGSELVRITVNDQEAAKAVPFIKERMITQGLKTPLIGDFHYNGHTLLSNHPDCAQSLDKYRINPGNVGTNEAREYNFRTMVEIAAKYQKPVRIGVNWGSLDQELFTKLMDENAGPRAVRKGGATPWVYFNEELPNHDSSSPLSSQEVLYEAMVQSALNSATLAEKTGLAPDKIVLSVKMSDVQDVIKVYQILASRCHYALHVGLTEAGQGAKGLVASSAALAILLQQGIGDTIRISLTPEPGAARAREVEACQLLLQTMGIRNFRPLISSCPGCGRTSSDFYQQLAKQINDHISQKMPEWSQKYPGVENLKIAVMGCIVNGPGESKHADIGISLPGKTEDPIAPVYIRGRQHTVLKGQNIAESFIQLLDDYIAQNYSKSA
jgi:(E)-4-hydroxy-3-methylbut-2-enyl-diphosphate synthase